MAVRGAGRPLPDAAVDLAVGAAWRRLPGDSLGRFRAAGLAAGAHVTRARRVGFVPRTDTLLVPAAGLAVVLPLGVPLAGESVARGAPGDAPEGPAPPSARAVSARLVESYGFPGLVLRLWRAGGPDSVRAEVYARYPAYTRAGRDLVPAGASDSARAAWERMGRASVEGRYGCRDFSPVGDEDWCRLPEYGPPDAAAALRRLEALGVGTPPRAEPPPTGAPLLVCVDGASAEVEVEAAAGRVAYRLRPCGLPSAEVARQEALLDALLRLAHQRNAAPP